MVSIPLEGAGMVAIISIDKRHNGDSRRALLFALASDVFIKHAIIVDDDIDVHDPARVLWALVTRFQADRDIIVVPNVRGYAEDPSGYYIDSEHAHGRVTTKIGYDATVVLGSDFPVPADLPPSQYATINGADYVSNPLVEDSGCR
jgi:UbiD family decarboxylase